MTASGRPIDANAFTAFRQGDEQALQQIFRAHYDALLEQAKGELDGDAAAASRVVERAFVRLWRERAAVASPEALQSAMSATVHEAAVRERSRLAGLHRFGAAAGKTTGTHHAAAPASSDEAWARLQAAVHAADAPVVHDARSGGKMAAAHMTAATKKTKSWVLPTVGIIIVGIGIIPAINLIFHRGDAYMGTAALESSDVRIVSSGAGQIAAVTLGDSTKTKLAPETRLRIPAAFGMSVRAVRLNGSGQFAVAPAALGGLDKPLDVRPAGLDNVILTSKAGPFEIGRAH